MNPRFFRLFLAASLIVIIFLAESLTPVYAAEPSASLFITPSSLGVAPGSTLTLSLSEDSGSEPINVVQTHIFFSTDYLQFLDVTPSDALSFSANSYEAGNISIFQGAYKPVSGKQLVATINFKVIGYSGNITLSPDPVISEGHSSVVSSNSHTNILKQIFGGLYSVSTSASSSQTSQPTTPQPVAPELSVTPQVKNSPLATNTNFQSVDNAIVSASNTKNTSTVEANPEASSSRDMKFILLVSLVIVASNLAGRTTSRSYKKRRAKKASGHHS